MIALRPSSSSNSPEAGSRLTGLRQSLMPPRRLPRSRYSLAILDRRLPDGDGVQLVPQIRSEQPRARIMMLTALDDDDQKVEGLDAGADDYLTKPYNPKELMARIRASLRRLDGVSLPLTKLANLSFAPETKEVMIDGRVLILQRRELVLLDALMRRPGRVVQRDRNR